MKDSFSNIEIITIAVYLLGGDSNYVDTEDIAIKVNELAPGRFTWRKYPDQINIDNVRKRLSDAKKPEKGGYLFGSFTEGWLLSENGLKFCRRAAKDLDSEKISRAPLNKKEMVWRHREKVRMLSTIAYEKVNRNNPDDVTIQEAETFFRLDDYVTGKAREKKILRIITAFNDDPELGHIIKTLAKKVRKNGRA